MNKLLSFCKNLENGIIFITFVKTYHMEQNTILEKTDGDKPRQSETISELAHRHLRDPNHVTTDEELRNVNMGFNTNDASLKLDDAAAKLDEEERADGHHFEEEKDRDDAGRLPGEKKIIVSPWNLTR